MYECMYEFNLKRQDEEKHTQMPWSWSNALLPDVSSICLENLPRPHNNQNKHNVKMKPLLTHDKSFED